jgi:hypothetical protein
MKACRCRRNGCQDAHRCEPRFREGLDHVRVALQHAVLEENAHPKEAHEASAPGNGARCSPMRERVDCCRFSGRGRAQLVPPASETQDANF